MVIAYPWITFMDRRMAGKTSSQRGSIVFHLHEGVGRLNDAIGVIRDLSLKCALALTARLLVSSLHNSQSSMII